MSLRSPADVVEVFLRIGTPVRERRLPPVLVPCIYRPPRNGEWRGASYAGYVQKSTRTTFPRRLALVMLRIEPHPVAPREKALTLTGRRMVAVSKRRAGSCGVPVDFNDQLWQKLRSFLRHIVADAIQDRCEYLPENLLA